MADEQHNANLLKILNTLGDAYLDQQHHNAQMFAELKNAVSESNPWGGHANKPPNLTRGRQRGHRGVYPTIHPLH